MKSISLIIPVYNVEAYLQRCLESVVACGYENMEILCVDDGSRDRSREILEEFRKRDGRIRILSQENRGVSAARNLGLSAARGELIGFVDGDDVVHPEYFRALTAALEVYGADVAVCGYRKWMPGQNTLWDADCLKPAYLLNGPDSMKDHTAKCFAWGRLYRRDVLKQVRFRENMALGEDRAFHLALVCGNPELRIARLDARLYGYCQRPDSTVAGASRENWRVLAEDILAGCRAEEDWRKALYLTECVKLAFSLREQCRKDRCGYPEASELVAACLEEMKRTPRLHPVRRIGYWLMAKMPWIYRGMLYVKERMEGR